VTQSYPLAWPDNWPRTSAAARKSGSAFKTTWDKARRNLGHELRLLGAQHVVVSSWLPLRLDGQPRSDHARMKIRDPGVAVYFEYRGRPMVMARDAYDNCFANLHSIGLAIEHLRGLERHGGAVMLERAFEGFAALPPPAKRDHWSTLGIKPTRDLDEIAAAFRLRAKDLHPDMGGDASLMADLLEARRSAIEEAAR
jgi:hypothetical protein